MNAPAAFSSDGSAALTAELERLIPHQHLRSVSLLGEVARRWSERQRFWHGPGHLRAMLTEIEGMGSGGGDRETLLLAALYHDAIYDPKAADNEEASAALLRSHAVDPQSAIIARTADLILASRWNRPPETALEKRFFALDTRQLADDIPRRERLAYERAIFRAYQWADGTTYREKRAAFLQGWARLYPQHERGARECQELLAGLEPRIAV